MNRILQIVGARSAAALLCRNTVAKHVLETPAFLPAGQSVVGNLTQVRTFRDKDVLKLRCNACYFKKIDNRMWVLCNKEGRHKQRQKIVDTRMEYIVSHITRQHSYKHKHYQYPFQDL